MQIRNQHFSSYMFPRPASQCSKHCSKHDFNIAFVLIVQQNNAWLWKEEKKLILLKKKMVAESK
jgi:hypothetical protein